MGHFMDGPNAGMEFIPDTTRKAYLEDDIFHMPIIMIDTGERTEILLTRQEAYKFLKSIGFDEFSASMMLDNPTRH